MQKTNSETITNEQDKEILKKMYKYPEERQKITDDIKLILYNSIIMEYQKITGLLGNTSNQPPKFKTKNWVEKNDESRGTYNKDNQIRFKYSMLRSSLCDYGDAYILVKGTVTVANTVAQGPTNNTANKKVMFKNCVPFINFISKINNTQVDDAHDIDVVMPMYNLIEYSDNYSKTSGISWQYCRDEPALDANNAIVDFNAANTSTNSFKLKAKITGQVSNNGTKNVEIMVPLKYLSNVLRTLEVLLINCKNNLDINRSKKWAIVAAVVANQGAIFSISDTKLYAPAVTLSTQYNTKLLEQLKSDFKRTVKWSKYQ